MSEATNASAIETEPNLFMPFFLPKTADKAYHRT